MHHLFGLQFGGGGVHIKSARPESLRQPLALSATLRLGHLLAELHLLALCALSLTLLDAPELDEAGAAREAVPVRISSIARPFLGLLVARIARIAPAQHHLVPFWVGRVETPRLHLATADGASQ